MDAPHFFAARRSCITHVVIFLLRKQQFVHVCLLSAFSWLLSISVW